MKAKLSLIALMIFSTSACTGKPSSHVPVGCLGLPSNNIQFTMEEAEAIPYTAVDKIVRMREVYKARINSQCEINIKHDELMSL